MRPSELAPTEASWRMASVRRWGAMFLVAQGCGAAAWWWVLFARPDSRHFFLATGAPDSTLLAFAGADLVLYAGGSLLAAGGLWRARPWAWPVLCVHAGAAAYAALYGIGLWCCDPRAWPPALLMSPSLVVPLWLAWRLRPRGTTAC